jgi:hypothetical protein
MRNEIRAKSRLDEVDRFNFTQRRKGKNSRRKGLTLYLCAFSLNFAPLREIGLLHHNEL